MDQERDKHRSSSSRKHDRDSHSHRDHHASSSRSHRHHSDKDETSKRHRSSRDDDKSSSKPKPSRPRSASPEWIEAGSTAPTQTAGPPIDTYGTFAVGDNRSIGGEKPLERLDASQLTDGYGDGEDGRGVMTEDDLFGAMGVARIKKEKKEKPDPTTMMGQSSRELNKLHWQGVPNPTSASTPAQSSATGSPAPGSTGSGWRMSKLKRTFEVAEEEGRPIDEVALERYGDLATFEEAKEERRILDNRGGGRAHGRGGYNGGGTPLGRAPLPPSRGGMMTPTDGGRRFVHTEVDQSGGSSRPGSRAGFRRPGEQPPVPTSTNPQTPQSSSRPQTPVPRVFAPTPPVSHSPRPTVPSALSQSTIPTPADELTVIASSKPVLSQSELNRLQAKVLKAKLMGGDNSAALEKEYEAERRRAAEAPIRSDEGDGPRTAVAVMPTLDGRGNLYDLGTGADPAPDPGKRSKDKKFVSHDPKTGELLNRTAEDDGVSIEEMVRQERFAAGSRDQKDADAALAARIAGDGRFKNELDYFDENADRLARHKMKNDTMKKAFAIQDYARTKKALDK